MAVAVLNPLGAGLSHYTKSLDHVLQTCGLSTHRFDVIEPSSADYGKVRWLSAYLLGVRREITRDRPDALVVSWAALGYWDIPILAAISRRIPVYLVMHDPRPLVYARGYGAAAKAFARNQARGTLLVHSPDAAQAVTDEAGMPNVFEVLHPMLEPRRLQPPSGEQRNIRVLGQYKADRDIAGLRQLAASAPPEWQLEIIGRGWPPIDGWDIKSEFVSEELFDELVYTSHAVLIPYARFFQSGVAVRALEWGVPIVGPSVSSLRIALGEESQWLVRDGDWTRSVHAAVDGSWDQGYAKGRDLYDRVISDWSKVLDEMSLR
jgi:hypothetical protein